MSDFVDKKAQQKPMEDGGNQTSSVNSDFERIPNIPLDGGQKQEDDNMEEHKTPVNSADGSGLGDDQQKQASDGSFEW